MMFPLATPAPHTLEHEGLISRNEDHHSIRGVGVETQSLRPRSIWAARAEDSGANPRSTLGTLGRCVSTISSLNDLAQDQWKTTSGLPAIPSRKPHPQTFHESLKFTRPVNFVPWWDDDEGIEEDVEDGDESFDESVYTASPVSVQAERMSHRCSEKPRRQRLLKGQTFCDDQDPESLLTPFALQARKLGADVLITGKRLRPSTGILLQNRFAEPEPTEVDSAHPPPGQRGSAASLAHEADMTAAPSAMRRCASESGLARRQPWRHAGTARPKRQLLGSLLHKKSPALPSLASAQMPPAAVRITSPALRDGARWPRLAEEPPAGPSVLLTEVDLEGTEEELAERPQLKAGPAGPWSSNAKLSVVRDLLDTYAANPLGDQPDGRCSGGRPGSASAAEFLERYVRRQAEIEALLEQRGAGQDGLTSGPSVQSAPF